MLLNLVEEICDECACSTCRVFPAHLTNRWATFVLSAATFVDNSNKNENTFVPPVPSCWLSHINECYDFKTNVLNWSNVTNLFWLLMCNYFIQHRYLYRTVILWIEQWISKLFFFSTVCDPVTPNHASVLYNIFRQSSAFFDPPFVLFVTWDLFLPSSHFFFLYRARRVKCALRDCTICNYSWFLY